LIDASASGRPFLVASGAAIGSGGPFLERLVGIALEHCCAARQMSISGIAL
jgi:hypothetical protein